jgi:glycosyltransferase involved in cell wall biosynthesis
VPLWSATAVGPLIRECRSAEFSVGFAGRLVEEKGVRDLVAATATMKPGVRLLFFGNGELREELEAASTPERPVEVVTDVAHEDMHRAYARMDVLALPSRTTPTWTEQFGRVLVEAMSCGRPAVASDSGEMPWVIAATGGGTTFPEGDISALTATLEALRADPRRRTSLAEAGRVAVEQTFSVPAVADLLDAALVAALGRKTRS